MLGALFSGDKGMALITDGYRMLNFHGAGITRRFNNNLTMLSFTCPTFPTIFLRSAEVNNLTALYGVKHLGGQSYECYVLGQAEVFVFTEQPGSSTYGMEIYSDSGLKLFNSTDQPVKPVGLINYPAMSINQSASWHHGSNGRKLAYNLHANRGQIVIDFGQKQLTSWRDVMQSVPGGFVLHAYRIFSGSIPSGIDTNTLHSFYGFDNPTSAMVIDVTDYKYEGMQSFTVY